MAQENTTTTSVAADAVTSSAVTPPSPQPVVTTPEIRSGPLSVQTPSPEPTATAAAVASTSQQAAEAQHPGVRELLKGLGLGQYERYADDKAALTDLVERAKAAEQMRDYARLGQQLLPHVTEFRKWQESQEAARQAEESKAKKSWWNAPAFDPRWAELIEQDPQTGQLRPREGAPLDIVQRFQEASRHSRDFLSKFSFDPIGSIKPGIEEVVRELAGQMVQEQVNSMQEKLAAREMLQQNAPWMYQADPATGRQTMTPYGQVYAQAVDQLDRRGIRDISLQDEWARDKAALSLMADQLRALQAQMVGLQQQTQQAPQLVNQPVAKPANPLQAQQAANQEFTRKRGGRKASQANPAPNDTTPSTSSLREMLLSALEEEGISRNGKLLASN